jgi:AcrR family transcriptional regulator
MSPKAPFFAPRRGYHHGSLKDALIEAARHLVAERGASGFTLSEAAKRVGVTAAAPYRHFSDRNDLMGELARRGFEIFSLKLEAAFDKGRPDPIVALGRMGAAYLAFAREEPGLYGAMFANAAALDAPGPGAAADHALDLLLQAALAILRAAGRPDGDARSLAFKIWSLSHGVAMLMLSGHLSKEAGGDPEAICRDGVAALVAQAVGTAKRA